MAIWSKFGKRSQSEKESQKQSEVPHSSAQTPFNEKQNERDMSRTTASLSQGGPIPAAPTSSIDPEDPKSARRRRGTNRSGKERRRQPSRDSNRSSASSVYTIDRSPKQPDSKAADKARQLDPIAPVSPFSSDFESRPYRRQRKSRRKRRSDRYSSAENITALPNSEVLKASPHLRPATKEHAELPYDFRNYGNRSRLGTPKPFELPPPITDPPKKKRNLLSRAPSDRNAGVPHLANLPLKLTKRNSRREPLRDEDIRAMMAPVPRPYPSGTTDRGILERDSQQIREGMNRRLARPQSTISLPRQDLSTRPSTRMSSLARPASAASGPTGSRAYRISVLDVLSPRPLIKVQEHPAAAIWGQDDDDLSKYPDTRPHTGATHLTFGTRKHGKQSQRKRVDDLVEDMDAGDLRLAMERDKKRKEKKGEREAERVKRRLERAVEKERAREAGDELESRDATAVENERPRTKDKNRGRKSKRGEKEPIQSERGTDEKFLPPTEPPKQTLPTQQDQESEEIPIEIPSYSFLGNDPDEDLPTRSGATTSEKKPRRYEDDEESLQSSPVTATFPLQALPAILDRKGLEGGRSRPPNMSLGPLLASSAAVSQNFGVGAEGNSTTALPPMPLSPGKKPRRRGATLMGLLRRAAGKPPKEDRKQNGEAQKEQRTSRAKSLIGSAFALGSKKSAEKDTRRDSVGPADLVADAPTATKTTSTSLARMLSGREKTKSREMSISAPIIPDSVVASSGGTQKRGSYPNPPPTGGSLNKPATPLRTRSIFKEQLSDAHLADVGLGTMQPLAGPFSMRSPTGIKEYFRSPTPPHLSEPKPEPTDYLLRGKRTESPFEVVFPGDGDAAVADETKELATPGSEGSWLTGKPVKRRPSTRGSNRPRAGTVGSSTERKRPSGASELEKPDLQPQGSFTLLQAPFAKVGAGHETDDASQSAYYDAESMQNPSTHGGESPEIGPLDPDDTLTPRPRSVQEGKIDGDLKIYGGDLGKRPDVKLGVRVRSREGLLG